MVRGLKNKMFNPELLLIVTCFTLSTAIRVDFGTKGGPIVPAAPTTRKPVPQPYRNPAPVWEDQSNDIPNPNKYQYVLPPPSRPKPATNNYKTSKPITGHQKPREFVFGKVIPPEYVNSYLTHTQTVSAFSPQYIPNYGFKYHSIVPQSQKTYYTKHTDFFYNDKLNKFNGKYNAKTKKYKAYEKSKYNPSVYYSNIIDQPALSFQNHQQQQLPLLQAPQPFRMSIEVMNPIQKATAAAIATNNNAVTTFKISTPKVINNSYSKDDLYSISKNYKLHHHQTQNSFSYESNKIRR
ncbi:uncharacterized protein LOC129912786 [Episyrphus balteatus]|uniref:uncharacterized protein LOC129912786 n=1 Tax=Episyrphus balteatus TaxID=286459 RepID=UPI00248582AA|nr:uncharacterized protein LOC129912786 [Episyrphus balteatus]